MLVLGLAEGQAQGDEWDRVAYWDAQYPSAWCGGGQGIRDGLEAAGYQILDADELKTWMEARIADKALSVVVFCQDVVPDTVAESMSATCTVRRYLDAGGKIVWYSDWPFYYQGSSDGTMVTWDSAGATNVLGFNVSSGPNDTYEEVLFTDAGVAWGLTQTWESRRPTSPTITENLTVLATISSGSAAAWVKHYVPGDNYRGFVRMFDQAGEANVDDIIRVAEYMATKAAGPSPADGSTYPDTWASLQWSPGAFAVSHDVYFSENFDAVNEGAAEAFRGNQVETYFVVGFPGFPYPDGLVPGTTYYWRIDEVDPANTYRGDVWSFLVPPRIAYNPNPLDSAKFVDPNADLSWTAGFGAKLHTVYFGDDFDAVSSAAGGLPQVATTYTLDQLAKDTVYYWRVDEFDGITTLKGDVWSFKTLPDIPIVDPDLMGWWKLDEGTGSTVVDWSGHGNHAMLNGDPQGVFGYDGDALEFDGIDDYVSRGAIGITSDAPRTIAGWAKMNRATNIPDWTNVFGFSAAGGNDLHFDIEVVGGTGTTTAGYYGIHVYGWEQNIMPPDLNWHHFAASYDGTTIRWYGDGALVGSESHPGLNTQGDIRMGKRIDTGGYFPGIVDDVRIYNKVLTLEEIQQTMRGDPLLAWNASPANGSTPYIRNAMPLSWSPGEKVAQHDVYFGTDKGTVTDADASDTSGIYRGRQSTTNYTPPEGVEWGGGPYYWRIDEFNTDGTISTGRVWSFTIADFIVVDDFEAYNDLEPPDPESNRIFLTWIDGYDTPTNGSQVGYLDPPFCEQTIVHSGRQSMPLFYNNSGPAYYSEATLPLGDTRDWTEEGVGVLTLWFYGDPANVAESMYVAVANATSPTAVFYHQNPDAALVDDWTQWNINLEEISNAGVSLTNVDSIAIGFGNRNNPQVGGSGMVFIDDIRLYRPAP